MARVDHKKIKQLIAQKQKTINDRQFFSSRILAAHFADIAAAQTRRYGYRRRVKVRTVWSPKEKHMALTNKEWIWINAGHEHVTHFKTRPERYEQVCGMFTHELGHVLYTDFPGSQTYHNYLSVGNWYPEAPIQRTSYERYAAAEYLDFARQGDKRAEMLTHVTHDIMNILEDGYVEQRMLMDYPGILGDCLQSLRSAFYEEVMTVSELVESEEEGGHIWLSILQILLSYMRWGKIKYGDTPLSDERIQVVFSLLPELDKALVSRDFRDRCRASNLILVRCWPYITSYLDYCEELAEQEPSGDGNGSAISGVMSRLAASLTGNSKEGEGDTAPVAGSVTASSPGSSPTTANRAATAQLAKEAEEAAEDKADGSAPTGGSDGTEPTEDAAGVTSGTDEAAGETSPGGQVSAPNAAQPVSDQEQGRMRLEDTDNVYAPENGGIEHDEDYCGSGYSGAATDIERLLEQMAEKSVCTELERQRTKELTELAQSISYGNIHDGVTMVVHRMAEVDEEVKEQYQDISGDLLHISKQLQRSVLQQLQDSRRGGKQTSLLMGRRLDTHALSRRDGRVFYKNSLPNETPALSVGLLLDESGSMCSCDRATYARATAIILYDFCQALGIPIMVYGHSTSETVDLYSYAEFNAIDRDDRYRLMDISARGGNRDGAALRFVADQLSKRSEDIKLLMIVSDGQPADTGYYGTAAEEDLRGIKREYQRKGILFIAAAIGSDKENIERIYGDSFLDITDLNKLPVKLAGIIKRYIRM